MIQVSGQRNPCGPEVARLFYFTELESHPIFEVTETLVEETLTRDHSLHRLAALVEGHYDEVGRLKHLGGVITVFQLLDHIFIGKNLFLSIQQENSCASWLIIKISL